MCTLHSMFKAWDSSVYLTFHAYGLGQFCVPYIPRLWLGTVLCTLHSMFMAWDSSVYLTFHVYGL